MEALFDKAEAGNSQCMLLVRCCMKFRNSMYIFWLIIVFLFIFWTQEIQKFQGYFFCWYVFFIQKNEDLWCVCSLCSVWFRYISSVMLLYLPYHVLAQRAPQNGHGFEMDVLVWKNMAINADFCKGDELWLMVNFNNRTIHGYIRCSYPVSSNVAGWFKDLKDSQGIFLTSRTESATRDLELSISGFFRLLNCCNLAKKNGKDGKLMQIAHEQGRTIGSGIAQSPKKNIFGEVQTTDFFCCFCSSKNKFFRPYYTMFEGMKIHKVQCFFTLGCFVGLFS